MHKMKKLILMLFLIPLISCTEKQTENQYDTAGNLIPTLFKSNDSKDSLQQFHNNKITSTVYFNQRTQEVDSLIGYEYFEDAIYKHFSAMKGENEGHYNLEKFDFEKNLVGEGSAKVIELNGQWVLIQDGWFNQYDNGNLIRKLEYMSIADSLFVNQIQELDENQNVLDSNSMYYEFKNSLKDLKPMEKYTNELEFHYEPKSDDENFNALLILTNELKSDFSNLYEIEEVENVYRVEPIDIKKWKFDLFFEEKGQYKLQGLIYITDHYFEANELDSSLYDAVIQEGFVLINEDIHVN